MAVGDHCRVVDGPFANFDGTVLEEDGDKIRVAIEMFGRTTPVVVDRGQLLAQGAHVSIDEICAQVIAAVVGNDVGQRRSFWWDLQARKWPPPAIDVVDAEQRAFEQQLAIERPAAEDAVRARVLAAFGGLDPAERTAKWAAEHGAWTMRSDEWRAAWQAHETKMFGELDDAALAAAREDFDRGKRRLRDNLDDWRRRQVFDRPAPVELLDAVAEAAIELDPSDASFLVYADWMQEVGNPRGELIALDVAGNKAEADALRTRLADLLFGKLVGWDLHATWRNGYLDTIRVETLRRDEAAFDLDDVLTVALNLPSARFLRSLAIACPSAHEDGPYGNLATILRAAGPRPLLRELSYVTNHEEEMLSWTWADEVSLGELYPNLEVLTVDAGGYTFTQPSYPTLRRLTLRTCSATIENLTAIASAAWPALEELEVWFGSSAYGKNFALEDYARLTRMALPKLHRLALNNGEQTDAVVHAILDSPLLPQLRVLEINRSTLTDTGAELLVQHADKLRHLETLDVDENYLSADALAALQRALPQTHSSSQREAEDYEGTLHRYAAVGE